MNSIELEKQKIYEFNIQKNQLLELNEIYEQDKIKNNTQWVEEFTIITKKTIFKYSNFELIQFFKNYKDSDAQKIIKLLNDVSFINLINYLEKKVINEKINENIEWERWKVVKKVEEISKLKEEKKIISTKKDEIQQISFNNELKIEEYEKIFNKFNSILKKFWVKTNIDLTDALEKAEQLNSIKNILINSWFNKLNIPTIQNFNLLINKLNILKKENKEYIKRISKIAGDVNNTAKNNFISKISYTESSNVIKSHNIGKNKIIDTSRDKYPKESFELIESYNNELIEENTKFKKQHWIDQEIIDRRENLYKKEKEKNTKLINEIKELKELHKDKLVLLNKEYEELIKIHEETIDIQTQTITQKSETIKKQSKIIDWKFNH